MNSADDYHADLMNAEPFRVKQPYLVASMACLGFAAGVLAGGLIWAVFS